MEKVYAKSGSNNILTTTRGHLRCFPFNNQTFWLHHQDQPSNAQDLALYNAAEAGDWEEAKSLLEQGYSPNDSKELHPKFGTTPLMEACFHGHQTIVQLYIEHNALLNTQSGYGWTALHYAGQANKIGCAGLLMAAGCNNLLKNSKGKTPQVRAAAQGKDEMAALIWDLREYLPYLCYSTQYILYVFKYTTYFYMCTNNK